MPFVDIMPTLFVQARSALLLGILALALVGAPVQASLITDTVTITCVAQFPAANTDCLTGGSGNFVVGAGAEASMTSGTGPVGIDIAAESIVLTALGGANFNGLSQILTFSGLNWVGVPTGVITSVEVLTSGTLNPMLGPVTHLDNSIEVDLGSPGWFAGTNPTVTINITTSHSAVPELGTIVLFGDGLLGMGLLRRRSAAK